LSAATGEGVELLRNAVLAGAKSKLKEYELA
jgi:hypothetical protein